MPAVVFLPETNSGVASPGKTAIFLALNNPPVNLYCFPDTDNFGL